MKTKIITTIEAGQEDGEIEEQTLKGSQKLSSEGVVEIVDLVMVGNLSLDQNFLQLHLFQNSLQAPLFI